MYEELVKRLHQRIALTTARSPLQDDLREAADAIEERDKAAKEWEALAESWEKACKGLESRMPRWIPVTERLPEDAYPVLVTYLGFYDKLPKSDMVAIYDDGDWYWYDDESKCKVVITHWMPLPEPPKEEA